MENIELLMKIEGILEERETKCNFVGSFKRFEESVTLRPFCTVVQRLIISINESQVLDYRILLYNLIILSENNQIIWSLYNLLVNFMRFLIKFCRYYARVLECVTCDS